MTWFPDMGTETMSAMGGAGEHIRAVGWLSAEHSFTQGEVPAEFSSRLREFAKKSCESTYALGWGIYMGLHDCELCNQSMASGNFGVPSGVLLFVAPEMIFHYVETHHYRPPDDFIKAVMSSPLPGTKEYRTEVEPFRRLHEQYQERREKEQRLYDAGRWAFERGGSPKAVSEAGSRFFCDTSPEMCERIRRLTEQYQERQTQEPRVHDAGRWAFERGGSPKAVSEAGARFFCDTSREMCERIRRAMPRA